MDDGEIPDYTLLCDGEVITYVEAKKMSADIQTHIPQLAKYCIKEGKEYGLLTNGSDWLLVKTFEVNTKLWDRIIWRVSIENDSISKLQSKLSSISFEQIKRLPELIQNDKQLEKFWADHVSANNDILGSLDKSKDQFAEFAATEIANDFLKQFPSNHHTLNSAKIFFKSNFLTFLSTPQENMATVDTQEIEIKTARQGFTNTGRKRKKAKSPSPQEWLNKIPELKKFGHLHSWQDICDHLKISVDGDSARRKLRAWVSDKKANWTPVP